MMQHVASERHELVVQALEAPLYGIEAAIDRGEPLVDRVEPIVDRLEALAEERNEILMLRRRHAAISTSARRSNSSASIRGHPFRRKAGTGQATVHIAVTRA